jgi:hypothetical protein
MVMKSLLVMTMLVMSWRDVIGGRNGLFRPPAFDTSPWHPVGKGNFNLLKQTAKQLVETTRYGKVENKENRNIRANGQVSDKTNTGSKTMENTNTVDIRENLILDTDTLKTKNLTKETHQQVNSIQDKIKILEENLETETADQKSEASEVRELRVEWSKKLERNKQRTEIPDIYVGKPNTRKHNNDEQSFQAESFASHDSLHPNSSPVQIDPIYFMNTVNDKFEPPRVHRSAFIDPEELAVDIKHDEMHHMDHNPRSSSKNKTNVQSENPHDKQFCVDISKYLDLKWVIKESEECHVNFNRKAIIQYALLVLLLFH